VVFHAIDSEKGEGEELSETYLIEGYPTFVLMNQDGEVLDRWMGFDENDVQGWIDRLDESKADPTTIAQKLERFESDPTPEQAARLGQIRSSEGLYVEAVDYYTKAVELGSEESHTFDIFVNQVYGVKDEYFTVDEVQASADQILVGGDADAEEMTVLGYYMARLARKHERPDLLAPYVEPVLAATVDVEDEWLVKRRKDILVEEALYVNRDAEQAVVLKREAMPEGWTEDADKLNSFAWWCFQNEVNLEEAEELARKGVELAGDAETRVAILDTVAEICHLRGDCGEAVAMIRLALEEDPESESLKEQLDRFEKSLENDCTEPETEAA
jgi:tetratricopeptide (TPR) repeat protein